MIEFFSLRRPRPLIDAIGFYLGHLILVTLILIAISYFMKTFDISGYSSGFGLRFGFGVTFSAVYCAVLYFAIYWKKGLRSILFFSLGLANILATLFAGALLGLVLVSLLSMRNIPSSN